MIRVTYQFPDGTDVGKHANIIAVGQTAGTWNDHFAHRESYFQEHLGQVVETTDTTAVVGFPRANTEGDIPTLLTMIFGKYSMAGPAKVVDVRLPDDYGTKAAFGLTGIRRTLGEGNRPLVMAIFKPALGLSPADHAAILKSVADAGIDIIKDDEILGDLEVAPTLERLRACRPILEARERPLLYAVNLTGPADQLVARARTLVSEGATALLLNVLAYGFGILEALAADGQVNVPIFAHPALAGAWCGAPNHGFSYSVVLGTLMAHAGADAVLYPAHYGSLPFDAEEEFRIRDILRGRNVFPVPSAGIKAPLIPRILEDYGDDVILNAGTGIMDYEGGPAAGVRAFHEAIAS